MKKFSLNPAYVVAMSLTGWTACATSQRLTLARTPGDFQNFMAFGNTALEDHRWPLARKYFLLAHEEEHENADAVTKLAMTDLLEDKDLGHARWMIEQELPAAGPKDTRCLLDTLARIALREGRLADATFALQEAEATASGDDPDFPVLLQETDDPLAQAPKP